MCNLVQHTCFQWETPSKWNKSNLIRPYCPGIIQQSWLIITTVSEQWCPCDAWHHTEACPSVPQPQERKPTVVLWCDTVGKVEVLWSEPLISHKEILQLVVSCSCPVQLAFIPCGLLSSCLPRSHHMWLALIPCDLLSFHVTCWLWLISCRMTLKHLHMASLCTADDGWKARAIASDEIEEGGRWLLCTC